MRKYQHLSREQRYAIYLGLQEKKTRSAIAGQIGCSVSTVCREINRNSNRHGRYLYKEADELAHIKRERSTANRKISEDVRDESRRLLIQEDWSPRQISGWLRLKGIRISHETIYRDIRNDADGVLREHCRHKMKYRRHAEVPKKAAGRSLIPDRVSIHERPPEADGTRFGDFEMDLVVGKDSKSAVLTVTERSTNMFFQTKVASKNPDTVEEAAYRTLLPYKGHILTITTDNGMEFRNHKSLARRLGTTVYFADPYCSGQKGAVENINKLLRQYFPKGTDFREVEQAELDAVQYKINRRPREKLNFSTPKVEFFKHFL